MRSDIFVVTAVVALGAVTPVRAQHQHGQMAPHPEMAAVYCGGSGGMMQGMGHARMGGKDMMHGMMTAPSPAMLLRHKSELALNESQVTQLEALQKEAQPVCMQHMQAGMAEHRAANEMLQAAAPDFTAFSAKLKAASGHIVEGYVAMAKAGVAARGILTPAQRDKMADVMKQVHRK
jgi:Spy/CpxP family protein refolding chaperone